MAGTVSVGLSIYRYIYIYKWGLLKIPLSFWYDRTPCASPLRALARVGFCHITNEQAGHFLNTHASTDLESDQSARQKGRIKVIN